MLSSIISMRFKNFIPAAVVATALISPACAKSSVDVTVNEEKAVPIEVVAKEWKCPTCNNNEQYVLDQLQEKTKISDRNALATIMGNIKSESNFIPNICEGGARVPYNACRSGGYGLIQWTSLGRYNNLGKFAIRYGYDPSTLEGQTAYMINESVFQRYLPEFEGTGKTIDQYMVAAYYWLGWGIKGHRQLYAYDYHKKLVFA
jgi:opacity protein-like surface antigen